MTDDIKYLSCGQHYIDKDDIDAVSDVLRSDWLTAGPTVHRFETLFAKAVNVQYAVSCSSGTAALHMACMAFNIGRNDRVIVPAISFMAAANAAAFCGADILFSDVDPDTGLMRSEDILQLINGLTKKERSSIKAIIPVNLSGRVVDVEAIREIARDHGWKVIIDSCQALGSVYTTGAGEAHVAGDCSFADMEVFSFQSENIITMGEGGAITTNDLGLYERLSMLRNHGIQSDPEKWVRDCGGKIPPPWYYEMHLLGYNYRLSEIQSALGVSQLNKLPGFREKIRRLAAMYDELFTSLSPHISPVKKRKTCESAYPSYGVLIDFKSMGEDRATFVNQLTVRNIGTQVHYIPVRNHPFYIGNYGKQHKPGAQAYFARTLSLPLHCSMTEADVVYVVDQIKEILTLLGSKA